MKGKMKDTFNIGGISFQRVAGLGLAFFFLFTYPAFTEPVDGGGLVDFLRGRTWQWFMDFFNFFILMILVWKFVIKKLILPALDEGISDIESRLSQEETEKQKLLSKIEELTARIAGLPNEEQQKLAQAEQQSVAIRKQVLEEARESELRILNQAEAEASAQLNLGVNELKKKFFAEIVSEVGENLSSKEAKASLKTYLLSVVKGLKASK